MGRKQIMTITEFLEARIAEDEQQAETCRELGWYPAGKYGLPVVSHARLLAECAAKRAIIALHDYEWMGPDDAAGKGCQHDYEDWPCPTIRALVAVYANHPDYQQEWAL